MTPGELIAICDTIYIKARKLRVRCNVSGAMYIQLEYTQADVETTTMEPQRGRKWFISEHATKSEVVQTALKAALTSAEHEVREHFRYRGRAVYGPHFDVEELWKLAGQPKDKRAVWACSQCGAAPGDPACSRCEQ